MNERVGAEPTATAVHERFGFVDIGKGIAIVLVVIGHALRGLVQANVVAEGPVVRAVDGFLYTFHVELFFVVSGLMIVRSADRASLGAYARDRIARLGWPYLVWAPFQHVVQSLAPSNHPQRLVDVWRVLYEPPMQFWFVAALLIQLLLFGALWKLGVGRIGFLVFSMVVYLGFAYVPLGWSVLYRVCEHLPYLAVGALIGRVDVLRRIRDMPPFAAAAIALSGFAWIALAVQRGVSEDRSLVLALGLLGSGAALALSSLLARSSLAPALLVLGERSLEIFVAHTIATAGTRVILLRVAHVTDPTLHLVLGIAAGILAPLILHRIATRLGWRFIFEWPGRPARAASAASVRPTA